jgi:hypothetical protein
MIERPVHQAALQKHSHELFVIRDLDVELHASRVRQSRADKRKLIDREECRSHIRRFLLEGHSRSGGRKQQVTNKRAIGIVQYGSSPGVLDQPASAADNHAAWKSCASRTQLPSS